MNSIRILLPLLCAGLAPAGAEGLKVIVNPSVGLSEISSKDLRAIFLGDTTAVKRGKAVYPVLNRGQDNLSRFASEYLGKSKTALETYYRSLVFTGRWPMPVSLPGDAEVVEYVGRTPGAISFIRDTSPPGALVTVRVVPGNR